MVADSIHEILIGARCFASSVCLDIYLSFSLSLSIYLLLLSLSVDALSAVSDNMLDCDDCHAWFHFPCVGLVEPEVLSSTTKV
jgi:hypothetical protein